MFITAAVMSRLNKENHCEVTEEAICSDSICNFPQTF